MKKRYFNLFATTIAVVFAMLFTSCSGELDDKRQLDLSGETVSVTLNASSFDFVTSPMTKTGVVSGLYGVQITDCKSNKVHACWLTEDLSDQSFKLIKGATYRVLVVFVPDGKNLLESKDGVYGPPFMQNPYSESPVLGHDIYYGDICNINTARYGRAQKKGQSSSDLQSNILNDIDIYYGGTEITADSDVTLDINLFRCMFGLDIEVLNFTEGKIHIYEYYYTHHTYATLRKINGVIYTLTPSENRLDKALELVIMPFYETSDESFQNYKSPLNLHIDYEYPDGTVVTLFEKDVKVSRMVKYSFSFDLEEVLKTATGGMNITIREEEWQYSTLDDAAPKWTWPSNPFGND